MVFAVFYGFQLVRFFGTTEHCFSKHTYQIRRKTGGPWGPSLKYVMHLGYNVLIGKWQSKLTFPVSAAFLPQETLLNMSLWSPHHIMARSLHHFLWPLGSSLHHSSNFHHSSPELALWMADFPPLVSSLYSHQAAGDSFLTVTFPMFPWDLKIPITCLLLTELSSNVSTGVKFPAGLPWVPPACPIQGSCPWPRFPSQEAPPHGGCLELGGGPWVDLQLPDLFRQWFPLCVPGFPRERHLCL